MKPLGRRLHCRPVVAEEHYPGSPIILTPDRIALETKQVAEVIEVGTREYDPELEEYIPMDPRLQPGAFIVHADFQRVYLDDGTFFLHENDVVAVIEE